MGKKTIQLDVMKKDDAKRILKKEDGTSQRRERLRNYLFEISEKEITRDEIKVFYDKYSNYNFEALQQKIIETYDTEGYRILWNFINKWVLICYSMTGGNRDFEKYMKFLKLVVKEQIKLNSYVKFDWSTKKFSQIENKILSQKERKVFKLFKDNEYKIDVKKILENLFE